MGDIGRDIGEGDFFLTVFWQGSKLKNREDWKV